MHRSIPGCDISSACIFLSALDHRHAFCTLTSVPKQPAPGLEGLTLYYNVRVQERKLPISDRQAVQHVCDSMESATALAQLLALGVLARPHVHDVNACAKEKQRLNID